MTNIRGNALWFTATLFRAQWGTIIRRAFSIAMAVAFVFTLVTMWYNFNSRYEEIGANIPPNRWVQITSDGFRILFPEELGNVEWVWNSTQILLTKDAYLLLKPLQLYFYIFTVTIVLLAIAKELAAIYHLTNIEAYTTRRDMAFAWALGMRSSKRFISFVSLQVFSVLLGVLLGWALALYLVLPYLFSVLSHTTANLFFNRGVTFLSYEISLIAPTFAVLLYMVICAWNNRSSRLLEIFKAE